MHLYVVVMIWITFGRKLTANVNNYADKGFNKNLNSENVAKFLLGVAGIAIVSGIVANYGPTYQEISSKELIRWALNGVSSINNVILTMITRKQDNLMQTSNYPFLDCWNDEV